MAEIGDLVPIDDNNTGRWPEGMPPSQVNDAGRADEGIMSRWHRDSNGSLTSTGTSTAYDVTTNQTLSAYYTGLEITFKAHVSSGNSPTLQLNALGAVSIVWPDDIEVMDGDIASGSLVNVIYNGSKWAVMNIPAASQVAYRVITTRGDIIRGDSSGERERLALGTAGQVLSSDGTDALWQDAALPRGFIDGFRLANDTTDAVNDLSIKPGACRDQADTVNVKTTNSFVKRGDATWAQGSGNGGRFTGSWLANTTYNIIAITQDSDGAVDFGFDTSPSGANAPSGWTARRRIGVLRTKTASAAWQEFQQDGDFFTLLATVSGDETSNLDTASSNLSSPSTFTCNNLPTGVELAAFGTLWMREASQNDDRALGVFHHATTAINSLRACQIYDKTGSTNERERATEINDLWCDTSGQFKAISSGGVDNGQFRLRGWRDLRGKDV